jgi:hypothetical protein
VKITRTVSDSMIENGTVAGTILDPVGAVVASAGITLVDVGSKKSREVKSDDNGHFQFSGVVPGVYRLEVKMAGFKDLVVKQLKISARETARVEATLLLDGTTMTVGILVSGPGDIDISEPGRMTISGEAIRKLPIP